MLVHHILPSLRALLSAPEIHFFKLNTMNLIFDIRRVPAYYYYYYFLTREVEDLKSSEDFNDFYQN